MRRREQSNVFEPSCTYAVRQRACKFRPTFRRVSCILYIDWCIIHEQSDQAHLASSCRVIVALVVEGNGGGIDSIDSHMRMMCVSVLTIS